MVPIHVRNRLEDDVHKAYRRIEEVVQKKIGAGKCYWKSPALFTDADCRMLLMADGILYEMHQKGIMHMNGTLAVREQIKHYVSYHTGSYDPDMVQTICRLLRYIGEHEEADRIDDVYGTPNKLVSA
jgi:hypothetical protein